MKIKILFFFLILASGIYSNEVIKSETITFYRYGNAYGMISISGGFGVLTTGNFSAGNFYAGSITRGYCDFNLTQIPADATIQDAKLHLVCYGTSTTVLINAVNGGWQSSFASAADWNSLNYSLIKSCTVNGDGNNNTIDLSGPDLIAYIKSRRNAFIGFGFVVSNESTTHLKLLEESANNYLTVTYEYSVSVPSIPSPPDIKTTTNITTSGCTLNYRDYVGPHTGYKIYKNGVYLDTTTSESYNVTGLPSACNTTFAVTSVNGDDESNKSPIINVLTKPLPPTNFVATGSSNKINFTWDTSSGTIQGYNIYQGSTTTAVSTTSNLNAVINNLISNTSYTFTIKSYNQSGESGPLTITTKTAILPAPYNVTYQNISGGWVFFWQYKDGSVSGYNIYQLSPQKQLIATINDSGYAYIHNYYFSSLPNGGSNTYGVSAFDAGGESSILSATMTYLLNTPTNLSVAYSPISGYTLSWTGSGSYVTGYKIYRKTPNSGLIATTSNTSYVLGPQSAFIPNIPYVYTVSAYIDGRCESAESSTTGFGYSASKAKSKYMLNDNSLTTTKSEVKLYPNPVKDKLFITGVLTSCDVVVINSQGQTVYTETNHSGSIDVSKLERGIYIVKIKFDGNEFVNRIIKQ